MLSYLAVEASNASRVSSAKQLKVATKVCSLAGLFLGGHVVEKVTPPISSWLMLDAFDPTCL